MKIQVIFGSQSDEGVYTPLCRSLESCGEVKMDVASAHRDPDKVRSIMTQSRADLFIAGAGLAAHLPGVVASLTDKPVFGVAVNGAFAGLDAFLSIAQMPKGVPVMAVAEENILKIAAQIEGWKSLPEEALYLHWNKSLETHSAIASSLKEIASLSGVTVKWAELDDAKSYGAILTLADIPSSAGVNVLLCEEDQISSPQSALDFFVKARQGGSWVGVNNLKNYVQQWQKIKTLKDQSWS